MESPFAAVRGRTTAAKRFKKISSATTIIWKVLPITETTFRCLNALEWLPAVYVGVGDADALKQAVDATHSKVAARAHLPSYRQHLIRTFFGGPLAGSKLPQDAAAGKHCGSCVTTVYSVVS
jgi:hypothetical protein